jgi:tRNA(Ile)-lysidine synthase
MHKFVRQLITEWRRLQLPSDNEAVVVGVSGGADSLSLLLALCDLAKRKKFGNRIIVAHLNHGLRAGDADEDEAFVRETASGLDVEFVSEQAKLTKRGNLGQNARRARYDFLGRVAKRFDAFAILTGHTMSDQAETFLMNLIRGSGQDGLSAMPSVRCCEQRGTDLGLSATHLVRPLLSWAKREDTEEYCRSMSVDFRVDSMNDDISFRRVQIRKHLLPLLASMNPKIIETLAATSELMRNAGATKVDNDMVSIAELRKLDSPRRLALLRSWLGHHRGNTRSLGLKHIQAVERLALSTKSGRKVELPGKATVIRSSGKLSYRRKEVEKRPGDN